LLDVEWVEDEDTQARMEISFDIVAKMLIMLRNLD
jgi:hypothetical protein